MEEYTKEDLNYFKQILEEHRQGVTKKIAEAMRESGESERGGLADDVDVAASLTAESLAHRLVDRDRKLLKSIDQALDRIEDGTYGWCEGTGEMIPRKRLEARPWCKYCIQYKEKLERHKRMSKVNGFTSLDDDDDDLD